MYYIYLSVVFSAVLYCLLISSEPIWIKFEKDLRTYWISKVLWFLSRASLLIFDFSIVIWGICRIIKFLS